MLQPVDECFGHSRQGYTLTLGYRVAGHTIRVEVHRDAYAEQSWALAEILTPALTWTRVAAHPPSLWWHDTPGPSAGNAAPLTPIATTVLRRALALLDTAPGTDTPTARPPAETATNR